MLRFRRYRVFLVVAVVFTILVVRLKQSGEWPSYSQIGDLGIPENAAEKGNGLSQAKDITPPTVKEPAKEAVQPSVIKGPASTSAKSKTASTAPIAPSTKTKPPAVAETIPKVVLPERKPIPPTRVIDEDVDEDDIHPVAPPGRQEFPVFSSVPTVIHWEKQVEHFPVPKESIIALPTGAPNTIPKIQFDFDDETTDAKINRQKRQSTVRAEFQKAWIGYKTKAWLHDELSPVSGKFRDPFCGWAATLVDTLDTLWIMGLQEDFEEAAKAVDLIDFTTSLRPDIPVFETTIRYLGGLLAAYDVSGAMYKNLLDKAIELAEILMGIFDTPNRMPDLYYRWKPAFASQSHRASSRSNLAELGSLSMEFTRLAQITKDPRYYDAVARITLALSEWQDRGTMLDGVFPDNVDASGCNRTQVGTQLPHTSGREPAIFPAKQDDEPVGFQPLSLDVNEYSPKKPVGKPPSGPGTLAMEVTPGTPPKAKIVGWEENHKPGVNKQFVKRDGMHAPNKTVPLSKPTTDPITGLPLDIPAAKAKIGSSVGDWDCIPQGLEPASPFGLSKFSMGGGQDSTYEYFPKQYLLLGGLEDVYRKMYMKTIAAVRKHMLYRPMTKDGRDILFSGAVTTYGNPEEDLKLSADVEHLTCFIGGMVGMGAKIFGIDGDLEIAKKLADGCVWAYESFPSGIMPESATVMPCASSESCPWNETAYWEFLDPVAPEVREKQIEDYFEQKLLREQEEKAEAARLAAALRAAEEAAEAGIGSGEGAIGASPVGFETTDPSKGSDSLKKEKPISLQKRQADSREDLPKPITGNFKDGSHAAKEGLQEPTLEKSGKTVGSSELNLSPKEKSYEQKALQTEAELDALEKTSGYTTEKPFKPPPIAPPPTDPWKPKSHTEYVEQRIKEQNLPPGFFNIKSRKYILRPEAIESVWYMYRITGDSIWQDKGWKMFTSIINATSTKYGHSAITDVTSEEPYQVDEMESFWLAETLKYFYLLYSPPDTISLDEWVLNTEAHPFKRPT